MTSAIGPDDFVFYKDAEGEIYSGGYRVNSILLKQGFSPMMTLNQTQNGGSVNNNNNENVSQLFDHMVVPNWSLAFPFKQGGGQQSYHKEEEENAKSMNEDDVIDEDIHSKLLKMLTVDEKSLKKGTKKNKKFILNKTKKQKNKKE
jgi:hypothetical protein